MKTTFPQYLNLKILVDSLRTFKDRSTRIVFMSIYCILVISCGSNSIAQFAKPQISCVGDCSKPMEMDTILVFPPRIKIHMLDFMGQSSYDWKITGEANDSLKIALSNYFKDSIYTDQEETLKKKYTVGLKFPEFDSVKRKLIIDSIPVISFKIIKRKADTTMYVPDLFYWLMERQHERYALIIYITGHVKKEEVYNTQAILHYVSLFRTGIGPAVKSMNQTNFTCHILDLKERRIIYSAFYSECLPPNYMFVQQYILSQFFDSYLEK